MARKKLFDRKFVLAAVLIGVAYAVIVVLVEKIVGKEAAGVAGVALTALAVGILQRFETLRYRKISAKESTWADDPPADIWRIITIIFAFVGAEYLFGFASGFLPERWFGEVGTTIMFIGIAFFVYFICSFLMAKAFVRLRYSTVAFAVLLTQLISLLMAVVQLRPETAYALQYGLRITIGGAQGVFCLLFEVVALLGVRLGLPPDDQ